MTWMKRMVSFPFLKKEIEGYGFSYSAKRYFTTMVLMLGMVLIVGLLYFLKLPYLVFLSLFCIAFLPFLVYSQFQFLYEQKRFDDVVIYLEQMSYSFQKHSKILLALKDTEKVSEGKLRELVQKTIAYIETAEYTTNFYESAFAIIEKEYGCSRIRTLHDFLIRVEESGGDYHRYLNVLAMDFNRWTERTYVYQKDLKNIKKKSIIAVIMAYFIASMSLFLKQYCDITPDLIYQVASTVFLAGCASFYMLIQAKLNGSWLERGRSEKYILRDYEKAVHRDPKKVQRKSLPLYLAFFAAAVFFLVLQQLFIAGVLALVAVILPFMPGINKKNARKRVIIQIQESFPEWLRDVALSLRFQTVQVSIRSSIKDCPPVLREAVQQLSEELKQSPSSVVPYCNFLKEFSLLDLTSNVKSLYSISEGGKEETAQNISTLMERNYVLMDKNAKMNKESRTTSISFLIYIPMILACFKLLFDMTVFISVFMQNMSA